MWKFSSPAILSNLTVGTEKAHNWNYPRWATLVAQMVKRLPAMRESQVQSLGPEDPLEKAMAPTPVFFPGEPHGRRSLVGYSPWGRKESDRTEQLHFHFLPL